VVTSSSQFFRQIGSTMGVALFGTFLTNHLNQALGKVMPGIDVGKLQGMAAAAGGAPMQAPPFVKEIVATAITDTFALGLYIVVVAVLVVLLIPQLPMRDMAAMRAEMAKAPGEGDPPVIPAEAHL
jgi:hypothetical protein